MDTWISNETQGRFLYINAGERINEFEREMARSAASENILPVSEIFRNGTKCYECCISGLVTMDEWLDQTETDSELISDVMLQISSAAGYLRTYLLSEKNLLMSSRTVFVDKNKGKLKFCIIPESVNNFEEGLKDIIHAMLIHIRIEDTDALKIGFRLLKLSETEDFRLHDVMEILGSRSDERNKEMGAEPDREVPVGAYGVYEGGYESEREMLHTDTDTNGEESIRINEADCGLAYQTEIQDDAERPGQEKKDHPAAGLIMSQLILLGAAAVVYIVKGRALVIRLLPLYLITAVGVVIYYAADHLLQKRRRNRL